jgi:chloramphenicol-sensitive protein RarD
MRLTQDLPDGVPSPSTESRGASRWRPRETDLRATSASARALVRGATIGSRKLRHKGVLYALAAYIMWGLFPIYWKQLESIPAVQLIGHRVAWSFLLVLLLVVASGQMPRLLAVLDARTLRTYVVAAILICTNWYVYVWAVIHGHVVEASLGYFINPLLSVLLGLILFRERLRFIQWAPIGLAAVGVAYLTFHFGSVPWIALVLAATFGLYGAMKKAAPLGSLFGLTLETGLLFVPALILLGLSEAQGTGAFLHTSAALDLMMIGGGVITAVPLLLFAGAASRVPLGTLGLLQYVTPTMQFLLGVFAYHERFTHVSLIGFGLVWLGLALFWLEGLYARRTAAGTPLPEMGEG